MRGWLRVESDVSYDHLRIQTVLPVLVDLELRARLHNARCDHREDERPEIKTDLGMLRDQRAQDLVDIARFKDSS
jgi:hypothetical protein